MRQRSGRGARGFRSAALAGLVLVTVSVPAAASGFVAGAPVGAATTEHLPVQVQVTSMSPAAVAPGDRLTVTGRIRNTGTATLLGVQIALRERSARLTTRADVAEWTTGTPGLLGAQLPGSVGVSRLDPGRVASFTLRADAGVTMRQTFGPRGIAVEVTAGSPKERVGLYRTTVVWMPNTPFEPTPISILVPITSPVPSEDAGLPTAALLDQLPPTGRLGRVVAATADDRIGWAIDPAVLEAADTAATRGSTSAPTTGSGPGSPPAATGSARPTGGATSGPPVASGTGTPAGAGSGIAAVSPEEAASAGDWLDAVRAGLPGRDVGALPYADPDVAALARQGAAAMLAAADQRARSTAGQILATQPSLTLGWPFGGAADQAALRLFAGSGRTAVVLDGRYAPLVEDHGYTPSAASQLPAGRRQLRGLLYDGALSEAFAGTGGPDPVGATRQLLSDLAALTLERPYDPRPQLLVTPRDWSPDPKAVPAAVSQLSDVPWVRITPVASLRDAAPSVLPRKPPAYPAAAAAQELPGAHVAAMAAADRRLVQFGTALVNARPVIDPLREQALSLVSASWRTDPAGAVAAGQSLVRQVAALYAGPTVLRGGPFNLLTGSAHLPLRVANTLPTAIRVKLTLRARSGRLLATQPLVLDLPPSSTRFVRVPVRSVADGTVAVDAELTSITGVPLGTPTTIEVRIHRNWEAHGILALGAALALVLLLGLFRSVRRGRTRVPPADVPDIDEIELYGPTGRPSYEDTAAAPAEQPTAPAEQPTAPAEQPTALAVRPGAGPGAALVTAGVSTTASTAGGDGRAVPPFDGPRLATAGPAARAPRTAGTAGTVGSRE